MHSLFHQEFFFSIKYKNNSCYFVYKEIIYFLLQPSYLTRNLCRLELQYISLIWNLML